MEFNANDWYWFVGGDTTRVFSSKLGNYVPVSDPTYQAWVSAGGFTNSIISEQELYTALTIRGIDPGILVDSADIPTVPLWALKAALASFSGGDKEAAYTAWITSNKATRINLFYQWQCGNNVERKAALVASIVNNTGLTVQQMASIYRDARRRAYGASVD